MNSHYSDWSQGGINHVRGLNFNSLLQIEPPPIREDSALFFLVVTLIFSSFFSIFFIRLTARKDNQRFEKRQVFVLECLHISSLKHLCPMNTSI
jgi:hypothetical protein